MNNKDAVKEYKEIREEYAYDADIFTADGDRVAAIKWIIENRLTQVERTLILLYADCQSYRKLGKRLGLSHTTVYTLIKDIKAKILHEYETIRKK